MKSPLFSALFALFVSANASAPAPSKAPVLPAPAPAPAVAMPATNEAAAPTQNETPAPLPALPTEMRLLAKFAGNGKVQITVVHPAHLVLLAQGEAQTLGYGSATLTVSRALPIRWETSDNGSLQTLVGDIALDTTQPGKPQATLLPTRAPKMLAETTAPRHSCKAFSRGSTTFSVLCRVDSITVSAARAFADKPQRGITRAVSGESTFFHVELDPEAEGVDALLLGYADGMRGHLVRAESSFLTGEQAPSIALLSSSRAQPTPLPRFFNHHPPHFDRIREFE